MILKDKHSRIILWGVLESDTHLMGRLAFIASSVYNPIVTLENGQKVQIPSEYLSQTYPTAANNLKFEKID